MDLEIPREVELKYEGRWIAWDTEVGQVLADGDTMEEVGVATKDSREAGKIIYYHYVIPRGTVLVGGLW